MLMWPVPHCYRSKFDDEHYRCWLHAFNLGCLYIKSPLHLGWQVHGAAHSAHGCFKSILGLGPNAFAVQIAPTPGQSWLLLLRPRVQGRRCDSSDGVLLVSEVSALKPGPWIVYRVLGVVGCRTMSYEHPSSISSFKVRLMVDPSTSCKLRIAASTCQYGVRSYAPGEQILKCAWRKRGSQLLAGDSVINV